MFDDFDSDVQLDVNPEVSPFTYSGGRSERAYLIESLGGFVADQVIADVLYKVKGGKEANVYCCRATPLAASEPVLSPGAGVLVFRAEPGDTLQPGAPVADLVDVDSGAVQTLHACSAGVLYARCSSRWAEPGQRIAKIAGSTLLRTGKLLSP